MSVMDQERLLREFDSLLPSWQTSSKVPATFSDLQMAPVMSS